MTPQSICQYNIVLQSQSFLTNMKNFLCKMKLVNHHSIPSTHAERKITVRSHNTILLHIPLLALTHPQTELQRNEYTRCAWPGGTFFPVVLLCQFLVLAGYRFWFYILMYLEYNTVVALCQFFGSGRKWFLVLRTYLVYNTVVRLCQFFCYGGKQFSK